MTVHEAGASEVPASATLGELVARRPALAELFERLRFDYCCGGAKTLAEACRERGLDLDGVRELIINADSARDHRAGMESHDWWQASLSELCDHIVEAHHDALRRKLPEIQELLDSVIRVHGPVELRLRALPATFAGLRGGLEPHMELEEQVLFPACRALEESDLSTPIDRAAVDAVEHDHDEVGGKLAQLRDLTGDYDTAQALCRTHHRLIDGLRWLELDLHQHIHEENNVLLPRLRALLRARQEDASHAHSDPASGAARSSEELPPCCRQWVAEQTHRAIVARGH